MEGMDTDDGELVERLKEQLRAQGRRTAFAEDAASVTSSDDPMANVGDAEGEDAFLSAMNALRRAKREGDRDAIAAAERHLQEVVRGEMSSFEGCGQ